MGGWKCWWATTLTQVSLLKPLRKCFQIYDRSRNNSTINTCVLLSSIQPLTCLRACEWCPTLCDPVNCSLPDSSVPGTSQATRCSGLPCPPSGARTRFCGFCAAGGFCTAGPLGKPSLCLPAFIKETSPEYSLEGLMLKLKLPILWPT